MSESQNINIKKRKHKNMYIGATRVELICQHARDISSLANDNIDPTKFLNFLIDAFSDSARAELLMKLREEERSVMMV